MLQSAASTTLVVGCAIAARAAMKFQQQQLQLKVSLSRTKGLYFVFCVLCFVMLGVSQCSTGVFVLCRLQSSPSVFFFFLCGVLSPVTRNF